MWEESGGWLKPLVNSYGEVGLFAMYGIPLWQMLKRGIDVGTGRYWLSRRRASRRRCTMGFWLALALPVVPSDVIRRTIRSFICSANLIKLS